MVSKHEYMNIVPPPPPPINDAGYATVVIDQYLLWDNYLDEICEKVLSGIGAIRKLKPYVTRETLVSVYYALVQPYFD